MKELLYQLWLTGLNGISSAKIFRIHEHFGSFAAAYEADYPDYAELFGTNTAAVMASKSLDAAEKILENCEKHGIDIITYYDERYPERLKEIGSSAPSLLYIKGTLPPVDERLTIGVVGARRSSLYGNACATSISQDLGRLGTIVISGMARGVDTAAHRGALKAEADTIAVLGCGVDVCYPPENHEIKRIIENHGAVISELPPGSSPLAANFPARNRIISGLSVGIVMVEGKATSGSTITARLAMEQGREVFCVPGAIDKQLSVGPHQLIRDGARLITSAKDIIIDLSGDYPELMLEVMLSEDAQERIAEHNNDKLPPEQQMVIGMLKSNFPTHIDEICYKTGIEIAVVNQSLMMLELNGYITSLPGKQYILNSK